MYYCSLVMTLHVNVYIGLHIETDFIVVMYIKVTLHGTINSRVSQGKRDERHFTPKGLLPGYPTVRE